VNLLNGDGIDVDRLDYTSRDLWASGVETSTIDLPRLLSSLCIRKHKKTYKLLFLKNAISVIESVLDVRNFLHAWIFSHHKVVYDQYLLKKAIETLAINITESRYDFDKANGKEKKRIQKKALSKLFSVDSFFEPQKIGKEKYHLHLITDDDLIFLMKQDIKNNQRTSSDNYMHSWLYREHKLSPLWKSYPEFRAIFEDISNTKLKKFDAKVEYLVKNIIKPTGYNYKIEHVKPSYHEISDKDIIVVIDKKLVFFRDLRLPQRSKDNLCPFFYIYGDFNEKDRKELTKELIRLAKKV
jgi:HD superfamily phosphohydrolase